MSEQTALTVAQRANIALGASEHEKKLVELAKQSTEIVKITNADGREQCHTSRMVLKNERVALEKLGKAARDDATKFSKAVIEEEKRLIGLIEPEEKRLEAIQKAWDDAIESEKQAKIKAEMERVAAIRKAINDIRSLVVIAGGKSTEEIYFVILGLFDDPISADSYHEFRDEAHGVKLETLNGLIDIHISKCLQEIEQDRIKAERAELERLRAEQQAREAEEQQKRAAENARIDAERKAEEAKRKAERDAEEARIAAIRKVEQERIDAEIRRIEKERYQMDREREEIEAKQRVMARLEQEAKEASERKQREIEAQRIAFEEAANAKAARLAALKNAKCGSSELALIMILSICNSSGGYEYPSEQIAEIALICEANLEKVAA